MEKEQLDPKKKSSKCRKLTNLQLAQLEAFAIAGFPFDLIANHFKLTKSKLAWFLKGDGEARELYKEAGEKAVQQVAGRLFRDAINGNTGAQCFYLKTQGKWKENHEQGVFNVPGPDLSKLTFEQLYALKHGRPPTPDEVDFINKSKGAITITIPAKEESK